MPNGTPDLFNSDGADMAMALLDAGAEFLLVVLKAILRAPLANLTRSHEAHRDALRVFV